MASLLTGCEPPDIPESLASVTDPPPVKVELGPVTCLSTEWYPKGPCDDEDFENRLIREIVRQAVLLAAREELGHVTRDETLGEPFPADDSAVGQHTADPVASPGASPKFEPLAIQLVVSWQGSWDARLHGAGATPESPIWHGQGSYVADQQKTYPDLVRQLTDAVPAIAEQLRKAGAVGEAVKLNPQNTPPPDIEVQLASMNFVAQFAAVRAAHQAMRENGPSLAWMGVLARGYANLAMLTDHTWSSQYAAFAARALLYAERMRQLSDDSPQAEWTRAYVLAIIGAHSAAIDQLDALAKTPSDNNAPPAWALLIEPFVKFDRDGLANVAEQNPALRQAAALLQWKQCHSYMHGRWIYEQGIATAEVCPEAFGIYSAMANWNALRTKRVGSSLATASFAAHLPGRVLSLTDLPAEARTLGGPEVSILRQLVDGEQPPSLSDLPIKFVQALRTAHNNETTPTECSWAVLASLIAEEQFLEAADMIKVSGDAVEHSSDELVAQLMPLVKGHRYAAYIESYAVSRNEPQRIAEILQRLTVVDPRVRMYPLFSRTWHTPTASGMIGNELAWRALFARDSTLGDSIDSYYGLATKWTDGVTPEQRQEFAESFHRVSPNCPNALRTKWETNDALKVDDLSKFEIELKDDPVGWMTLGNRYYKLGDLNASERCFKRSLEISPCKDSTIGLANSYYYNGKKELWQPTLESYLKIDDLGLAHADIHQLIAEENIRNSEWAKAEPHAREAAETYSASGLLMAANTYEGLQQWDKSEHFYAEATRSYPTYLTGTSWYFWCRRNGRGDLDAARAIAAKNIELAARQTRFEEAYRAYFYRLLEGDKAAALAGLDQQIASCLGDERPWDSAWRQLHIIAVSSELKDTARRDQAASELQTIVAEKIQPGNKLDWVEFYDGLNSAFAGKQPTDEYLTHFDKLINESDATFRSNYNYLLGTAFDQLGQRDKAELYWRRALYGGPVDGYSATLAGRHLTERYGAERGGTRADFAKLTAVHAESGNADSKTENPPANDTNDKSTEEPSG